jgi:hypothetical protein
MSLNLQQTVAAMLKQEEEFLAALDPLPKDISQKDLDEFLAAWFPTNIGDVESGKKKNSS